MTATTLDRYSGHVPDKLLTRDYVFVCLATLALTGGLFLLLPTLPLYIKNLKGSDVDVGLVMGLFSLSALVTRLLAGRAADLWGRKWLLVGGGFVFFLGMVACAAASDLTSLAVSRFLQGLGFGVMTTAGATLVTDIAPPRLRTQALGYYTLTSMVAMAAAPGVGVMMLGINSFPLVGFQLVFALGAVLSALSLFTTFFVREANRGAQRRTAARFSARDFFVPAALPVSLSMLLSGTSYGAIVTFLPLYAGPQNVQNVGLFFFLYAFVVLLSRPLTGYLADRVGRRKVLIPAMLLSVAATTLVALPPELPALAVVAIIYGLGFGNIFPSLLALGIEDVPEERRGVSMGIFLAAFDSGAAIGSMAFAGVAEAAGYAFMFLTAGAVSAVSVAYFVCYPRFLKRASAPIDNTGKL